MSSTNCERRVDTAGEPIRFDLLGLQNPFPIAWKPSKQTLEGDLLLQALGGDAGAQRLIPQALEHLRSKARRCLTSLALCHWTLPPR